MSLEIGDIDELAMHAAEDTISDVDALSTPAGLSGADILSCDFASTEDLGIGEPGEHETEYPSEITSANLSRPDSMIDRTESSSTLAAESDHTETSRVQEFETKIEAEVTKIIVELCGVNINDGSLSGIAPVSERLEREEDEEVRTRTYAEVARADPSTPKPLAGNNGAAKLSDVVIATGATQLTVEAIKEGNCVVEMVVDTGDTTKDAGGGENFEELIYDMGLGGVRDRVGKGYHVKQVVIDAVVRDIMKANPVLHEEGNQDSEDTSQSTSENVLENHKIEPKSMSYSTVESKTRNEEDEEDEDDEKVEGRLVNDAMDCTLTGEDGYLLNPKQLPLEAGKHVIELRVESIAFNAPDGLCLVNIIGISHVSKESCEEVEALIRQVKPAVVFLELCSHRTNALLQRKNKVLTFSGMLESYKRKETNLFGLIYSWYLAKVGEKLDVIPGTEFRVAYEEAVRCGATVILGDRPIQITLKRTWGRMNLWLKAKFLFTMFTATFNMPSADELALMDQSGDLTIMAQGLSKTFPILSDTLVQERDLYMVTSLRNVASCSSSVVAVVGRTHLSGIAKHWNEDIDVEELMTLPLEDSSRRLWFWCTVALGVGVVVGAHLMRRR